MGLDVLFNGGCSVRLFIQGCLILWLGLFSSSAFSWSNTDSEPYYINGNSPTYEESVQKLRSEYQNKHPCTSRPCRLTPKTTTASSNNYFLVYLQSAPYGSDPSECGTDWVGSWCDNNAEPPCVSPNFIHPETGECSSPQEPEECYENGQVFDAEYGYCVLDCPNGQLNGVCLQDTADNADGCNSESPDYKGSIGYGDQKQNICESDTTCEGGSLGIVNNVQMCIPDEYGPPTCAKEDVLVMDEYGWVCSSPDNPPEPDPEPEPEPNTDTDGDGEPDEYQEGNDPESVDKGLDDVGEAIGETNKELGKANKQLENLGKGISEINENLNEGLGAANDTLTEIKEGMQPPEGGFNPDGFGGLVPTFSETASDFSQSISAIPAVSAVTGLADLPESLTCPVYTIPATPISGPVALDIHCQVFNDYRGVISALFLFFWTGTALFIFLRA